MSESNMTKPKYKVWDKVVVERKIYWLYYMIVACIDVSEEHKTAKVLYKCWDWRVYEDEIRKPTQEEIDLYYS